MSLYIGVDFHPHQQTAAWCDTETGEVKTLDLRHNTPQVRLFYQQLPAAIVGIEASVNAVWFEQMLAEFGHELRIGNPALIRARARSRHKSDKRDAELILDLMLKQEFPTIWRRPAQSSETLEILRLRLNLVQQRTQVYNRLQALAHGLGLPKGKMSTAVFQNQLKNCTVGDASAMRRNQLFLLLSQLNEQIGELESWLKARAATDDQVQLLLTQKGVGYLTALCLVNTVGDVQRFSRISKQVVAFVGLDPLERSSAGKTKTGGISRAGSFLCRFQVGQAAALCLRYDEKLKAFYKRLSKKKPKRVAKTAATRKLLVKLAIMLRDKITAAEFDRRGIAACECSYLHKV